MSDQGLQIMITSTDHWDLSLAGTYQELKANNDAKKLAPRSLAEMRQFSAEKEHLLTRKDYLSTVLPFLSHSATCCQLNANQ